jgi:hypothetical protein
VRNLCVVLQLDVVTKNLSCKMNTTRSKRPPLSKILSKEVSTELRKEILDTLSYRDNVLAEKWIPKPKHVYDFFSTFEKEEDHARRRKAPTRKTGLSKILRSLYRKLQRRSDPVRSQSLGMLDVLPVEIMEQILRELDLRSLRNFSQASTPAASRVVNIPVIKFIVRHASPALPLMLESGVASYFTAHDLHRAITSPSCAFCPTDLHRSERGKLAHLIFLPTCQRICTSCTTGIGGTVSDLVCPVPAADFFELPPDLLEERHVPIFWTPRVGDMIDRCPSCTDLMDSCARFPWNEEVRLPMVTLRDIIALAREVHGPNLTRFGRKKGNMKHFRHWMGLISDPEGEERQHEDTIEYSLEEQSGDSETLEESYHKLWSVINMNVPTFSNHLVFPVHLMWFTVIPVPFIDLAEGDTVAKPMSCAGCQYTRIRGGWQKLEPLTRLLWTEKGLLEHIKRCKDAEKVWQNPGLKPSPPK